MSVYACSDLHGCLEQWLTIKSFLKENDRVFVLGDCADRGPDGWGTLKSVLAEPRATLLKGNHEDMLLKVLEEEEEGWPAEGAFWLLTRNGGAPTYDAWQEDGRDFKWISVLKHLPTHATYVNKEGKTIWLSHSGCPPLRNKHTGALVIPERMAIWDRDHITENWHCDENIICVHGHTPVPYLMEELGELPFGCEGEFEPGAFWYCDNHKVCIDNASFFTGNVVLLDLDTWEEHIFF